VTTLLRISLVALEIVNARGDKLACLLSGTDGVNGVADHLQRLERNHHFVVFDVIADEHENGFLRHVASVWIVADEGFWPKWDKKLNGRGGEMAALRVQRFGSKEAVQYEKDRVSNRDG
jgi:hypothetical protein